MILSYQKNIEQLNVFTCNVLKDIEALKILHEASQASKYLTSSAGVVLFKQGHLLNADDMYKKVDELLYEAKASGRNNFKSIVVD